jgi:hypothetical protein
VSIVSPQRFRQAINNRMVTIDVRNVGRDRWRAELARPTGSPTALMPFYGTTPDEAAQHLFEWLTRVRRQAG